MLFDKFRKLKIALWQLLHMRIAQFNIRRKLKEKQKYLNSSRILMLLSTFHAKTNGNSILF